MSWTLCTSGAAIARAGTHANSTLIAYGGTNKTILDGFSDQAERMIEGETGMSIVSNFASYQLSGAASMAAAAKIAMMIISYDSTGYLSREADTLMNNNDTDYKAGVKNMKDFKNTELQSPLSNA